MNEILLIIALVLFISATFIVKSAREKLKMSKSILNELLEDYVKVLTLYRDLLLVVKHEDLHKLIGRARGSKDWLYK